NCPCGKRATGAWRRLCTRVVVLLSVSRRAHALRAHTHRRRWTCWALTSNSFHADTIGERACVHVCVLTCLASVCACWAHEIHLRCGCLGWRLQKLRAQVVLTGVQSANMHARAQPSNTHTVRDHSQGGRRRQELVCKPGVGLRVVRAVCVCVRVCVC